MPSLNARGQRDREKTTTLEVVPGFDITLTYRPNRVTFAVQTADEIAAAAGEPTAIARELCDRLIVSWDLTGPLNHAYTDEVLVPDEATTIPLDAETVQHIDPEVLIGVLQAITQDAIPNLPKQGRRRPSRTR